MILVCFLGGECRNELHLSCALKLQGTGCPSCRAQMFEEPPGGYPGDVHVGTAFRLITQSSIANAQSEVIAISKVMHFFSNSKLTFDLLLLTTFCFCHLAYFC